MRSSLKYEIYCDDPSDLLGKERVINSSSNLCQSWIIYRIDKSRRIDDSLVPSVYFYPHIFIKDERVGCHQMLFANPGDIGLVRAVRLLTRLSSLSFLSL
jgi:hypothetical protein